MMPWAVIYKKLPAITGSRFFGFWEMIVYLGFVAVGIFYIVRKGIPDRFIEHGDRNDLLSDCGLSVDKLAAAVRAHHTAEMA